MKPNTIQFPAATCSCCKKKYKDGIRLDEIPESDRATYSGKCRRCSERFWIVKSAILETYGIEASEAGVWAFVEAMALAEAHGMTFEEFKGATEETVRRYVQDLTDKRNKGG